VKSFISAAPFPNCRDGFPEDQLIAENIHQHFVLISLWKILNAYELRQTNPCLALWDIGNRIHLGANAWEKGKRTEWPADLSPNPKTPDAAEMVSLASATLRMIKKAQKAIENTGMGKFPKFN
jgi:hypothetical protein